MSYHHTARIVPRGSWIGHFDDSICTALHDELRGSIRSPATEDGYGVYEALGFGNDFVVELRGFRCYLAPGASCLVSGAGYDEIGSGKGDGADLGERLLVLNMENEARGSHIGQMAF